jgi:hypothetical protein
VKRALLVVRLQGARLPQRLAFFEAQWAFFAGELEKSHLKDTQQHF